MSTTKGISVDNLDHNVKRPAASKAFLAARREAAIKDAYAEGHRGETTITYHMEPVYHAATGEQVHGFVHPHTTTVHINEDGTADDLGNP